MATSSSTAPTVDELKARFSMFDIRLHPDQFAITNLHKIQPAKEASVLIPLFYKNGELRVLLTLRSTTMSKHAGQVAFPGGMKDDGDADVIETALRETEEEVGISKDKIKVICVLPQNVLGSLTVVTPVLALLSPDFQVVPNPREVSLVFDLPLKRFLSSERSTINRFGGANAFVIYHYDDDVDGRNVDTWGFTASVCMRVAIVAFQSDLRVELSRNRSAGKEDCFSITGSIAFIEFMTNPKSAAKL